MEIYKGMAGSPITYLASDISAGQTTISVADDTALPDAPNICTIGYGEEIETIKYGAKSNGVLQNVVRGVEGAPRAWQAGTEVARFFTAYDHDAIAEVLSKNPVWFSEFEEALINSVSTKIFKNLFGNGSKIHASEIAVAPGLLLPEAVIVESGNNENGEYVRWGNGLQMCWGSGTLSYSTNFILNFRWTFPKPFISPPNATPNIGLESNRDTTTAYVRAFCAGTSTNETNVRLQNISGKWVSGDNAPCMPFAIGRWK